MTMFEIADSVLGLSLKSEQLGYGHMAARALLMYLLLVVIVRSAKKRFLSNATAFDFILTVDRGCGGSGNDRWSAVFSSDTRRRCHGAYPLGVLPGRAAIPRVQRDT